MLIDEAHNLAEAVNAANSATLSAADLRVCGEVLRMYAKRFKSFLSAKNLFFISTLRSVVTRLSAMLVPNAKGRIMESMATGGSGGTGTPRVQRCNEFVFSAKLDSVNLFQLCAQVREGRIAPKLGGFAEFELEKWKRKLWTATEAVSASSGAEPLPDSFSVETLQSEVSKLKGWAHATHSFRQLLTLLSCLLNEDADGRVFTTPSSARAPADPVGPGQPRDGCDKGAGAGAGAGAIKNKNASGVDNTSLGSDSATTALAHADPASTGDIRFVLLNPAAAFSSVVQSARSIALLGGTMQVCLLHIYKCPPLRLLVHNAQLYISIYLYLSALT